jgi:hypothetical protein
MIVSRKPATGGASFVPAAYQNVTIPEGAFGSAGESLLAVGRGLSNTAESFDGVVEAKRKDDLIQNDQEPENQTPSLNRPERDQVISSAFDLETGILGQCFAPSQTDGGPPNSSAGYFKTQGQDAIDGLEPAKQGIEQQNQQIRSSLPTEAQRKSYDAATAETRQNLGLAMQQHRDQELAKQTGMVAQKAADGSMQSYIAFADRPDLAKTHWETGPVEAGRFAALHPEKGVLPEDARKQWRSSAVYGAVEAKLDEQGSGWAEGYLKDYGSYLLPEEKAKADQLIQHKRDQEEAVGFSLPPLHIGPVKPTKPVEAEQVDRKAPSTPPAAKQQAVSMGPRQEESYDIKTFQQVKEAFDKAADAGGLSPAARAIAWDRQKATYIKTVDQARQDHSQRLTEAQQLIQDDVLIGQLPPRLTNNMSTREKESLQRWQDIHLEKRRPETEWTTFYHLSALDDRTLSQRVLAEDVPFLSPTSRMVWGGISNMLQSSDIRQVAKARSYMLAMGSVADVALSGGPEMQTSDALDAMQLRALKIVDGLIERHGAVTPRQIYAALAPLYLDDVEQRIATEGFKPVSSENRLVSMVARGTGISHDMVVPTFDSLRRSPNPDLSITGMRAHFDDNVPNILADLTGAPISLILPIVREFKATGRPITLYGVRRTLSLLPQDNPYMPQ